MNNHELIIEIGGISSKFILTDKKFLSASRKRFSRFLTRENKSDYSVFLLTHPVPLRFAAGTASPVPLRGTPLLIEGNKHFLGSGRGLKVKLNRPLLNIKRDDFHSVIDLEKKCGDAHIANRINSFETFLRILYSCLLLNENGMLLHSSGIITKNGKEAIMFPGMSGAGKTTIAKCLPRKKVLNDEILGITFASGRICVFSTPFWGSGGQSLRGIEPRKFYALKAVLFPEKSRKIFFKNVPPGHTVKRILRCALNFVKQKDYSTKLLNLAVQIATVIPAKKFYFYPDKKLYNIIGSS